jgi:hypothetical protein
VLESVDVAPEQTVIVPLIAAGRSFAVIVTEDPEEQPALVAVTEYVLSPTVPGVILVEEHVVHAIPLAPLSPLHAYVGVPAIVAVRTILSTVQ